MVNRDCRYIERYEKLALTRYIYIEDSRIKNLRIKIRLKDIVSFLKPNGSQLLLDVGGGEGFYSNYLSQYYKRIYLIEISKNRIKLGKIRYNNPKIEYIWGDAVELPFKDESFDHVISLDVLEHVPEDKRMLAEIYRVLKTEGKCVISTVNPLSPIHWLLLNIGVISYEKVKHKIYTPDGHIHGYNPKMLKKMLTEVGFDVVKIVGEDLAFTPFYKFKKRYYSIEYKIGRIFPNLSFYIVAYCVKK